MAERIIGVDFGTSTSVIRVKRYENGTPIGEKLETKEVIFGGNGAMVPTLIMKKDDDPSVAYYGYEAQQKKRRFTNYQSFKVDLESANNEKRAQARELTEEFFAYLGKQYRTQSDGGHLGNPDDKERTIISYPVKWSEETKQFMLEAAKKAGFPNVTGMDEAQAAIQAVTVMSTDHLKKNGLLANGKSANILLIDMGAGTTDLVLCRYTPGAEEPPKILSTWPKSGKLFFGGKEIDALLKNFFWDKLDEEDAQQVFQRIGTDKFKSWKENTVSPALLKNDSVSDFEVLDSCVEMMGIDMDEYCLNRAAFEECLKGYLKQFPILINGCIQDSGVNGSDVDLVIVTGGHSQWYFVQEMLSGKMEQFGRIDLPKIRENPARIIPIPRPQETVALGLVYGRLTPVVNQPETHRVSAANNSAREIRSTQKEVVCGSIVEARAAMMAKAHGAAIAAGSDDTVGLKSDGTVITTRFGNLKDFDKILFDYAIQEYGMNKWHDIIAIAVGNSHAVGLRSDGTVVATGRNSYGSCNVSIWHDITAVAAGWDNTVGLRSNGTVVAIGDYGVGKGNVSNWHDIIAVGAGRDHTVGLRSNGTVVATGSNEFGQCDVNNWHDIIAISAGCKHTVGLKSDGTVVATGRDTWGEWNVSSWHDIIAVSTGGDHIVGLKRDGTVVATGHDGGTGRCNVSSWQNIIAVAVGDDHTVGLRSDGTVVATGWNHSGQCNVQSWKLL